MTMQALISEFNSIYETGSIASQDLACLCRAITSKDVTVIERYTPGEGGFFQFDYEEYLAEIAELALIEIEASKP